MPQDGPQLGNPKTAKVFNDNFFRDFRKLLGADSPIVKLSLCDFSVSGGGRGHCRFMRARVCVAQDCVRVRRR